MFNLTLDIGKSHQLRSIQQQMEKDNDGSSSSSTVVVSEGMLYT